MNTLIISKSSLLLLQTFEKRTLKSHFLAKFDRAANVGMVSFMTHISDKWMILHVYLKEETAHYYLQMLNNSEKIPKLNGYNF